MKEFMEEDIDFNSENSLCFVVDKEQYDAYLSGADNCLSVEINDSNYNLLLETLDGALVIDMEEVPTEYHGCYYLNNGQFPYFWNESLKYLLFTDKVRLLRTAILSREVEPGQRFRFEKGSKPGIADPNGDNCLWQAKFSFKVIDEKTFPESAETSNSHAFILRWNPGISSFTLDDYRDFMTKYPKGFRINWSVYEWQEAHEGDTYYMVRVGEGNTGLVFFGDFLSEPVEGDDWDGKNFKRRYVDISCHMCRSADEPTWLSIDELNEAIPEVDWAHGHSGELLSEESKEKLCRLLADRIVREKFKG